MTINVDLDGDDNSSIDSCNKISVKLKELRKEREYYKNELEKEKNKSKRSLINIWTLESRLDDIENLIMKELKK
ncbi:hypothetical protein [Brachyspira intermedia]|uniref:hypothetical protein n=1 Tax=Brachyspira intermedia TaxID=84377 RepID=UPI003006DDEE